MLRAATLFVCTSLLFSLTADELVENMNERTSPQDMQSELSMVLKNKKGSILYISSSSALDGNEGRSSYSSAKGALITQSKVLSRELGPLNIRVNTIAPGLTNTDMMKKNTPQEILKDVLSRVSLRRVGQPDEIANVALLLSSDLSSYITGQVIRVDGGM